MGIIGIITAQHIEICDNATDDDNDGLIDINDPDCECVEVVPISRIPNPSFEETNCCPSNRSQLYCAEGWIQASEATTDLIHECGWGGWPEFVPPRPFPDGEGIVGFRDGRLRRNGGGQEINWKEYAGACLTAPLLKGETYRFEFYVGFVNPTVSPTLPITFFGSPSCDYLPFGTGNEAIGCPTNDTGWVRLSSVTVNGSNQWKKANIEITPDQDIYAIAIGPACQRTSAIVSTYYFFDNLVLDELENFELVINEASHPCSDNFILSIPVISEDYTYQWYRDGIALIGENASKLEKVTEGDYQVRLQKNGECRVTSIYSHEVPIISQPVAMKVCDGESFAFGDREISESGVYVDTFISYYGCDSIVTLTVEGLSTIRDTLSAKVFPGDTYYYEGYSFNSEGEHIVGLKDADGCDYYVHIMLEYFAVYWPNIFSPNGDGQNDYFNIYGNSDLVIVKEMFIYNRWGGKIFHTTNIQPNVGDGWDGSSGNGIADNGIYVFKAIVVMENGLEKDLYGSVLLTR